MKIRSCILSILVSLTLAILLCTCSGSSSPVSPGSDNKNTQYSLGDQTGSHDQINNDDEDNDGENENEGINEDDNDGDNENQGNNDDDDDVEEEEESP